MPKRLWVVDPNTDQGYSMDVEEANDEGLLRSKDERAEMKSRRPRPGSHLQVVDGERAQMQAQPAQSLYQPPRQKEMMLKVGGVQCDFCDSVHLLDDDDLQRVAIHWMKANGLFVPEDFKAAKAQVRDGSQDAIVEGAKEIAASYRGAPQERPAKPEPDDEPDVDQARERAQEIRDEHEEAGVAGMTLNVKDDDFTVEEKLTILHQYRDGLKMKMSWQKLDRLCRDRSATRDQVKRWDQMEKDGQLTMDEK